MRMFLYKLSIIELFYQFYLNLNFLFKSILNILQLQANRRSFLIHQDSFIQLQSRFIFRFFRILHSSYSEIFYEKKENLENIHGSHRSLIQINSIIRLEMSRHIQVKIIISQCNTQKKEKREMNKRKIEINQVKKQALRGKKHKFITTKYQVALSYFKQKDPKNQKIFTITFQTLIHDLLDQLTNIQIIYKLENAIKQQIPSLQIGEGMLKFQAQSLKYVSKQLPIDQIMKCITVKKEPLTKAISLQITKNKLMLFFKHIRGIYPQFCFCVGEKIIVESCEIKNFYEFFKVQWGKLYERGRINMSEKIQKLICRSLYFIGALVQNSIFEQIQEQETKKKEENVDLGTKSQKKRNVKGINQQVSSTYSFGSNNDLTSNFSYGLNSQQSNEQNYYKSGYSQKSQKIIRKDRCHLWDKVEIKNLRIKIPVQHQAMGNSSQGQEQSKYEIDLLSNDVENIYIEQAFKIRKLKDACERNRFDMLLTSNPYEAYQNANQNMSSYNMNLNMNMNCYNPSFYPQYAYQQQMQNYLNSYMHSNISEDSDLYNIRRTSATNLVETRKTHSRQGGNKYS